MGMRKIVHGFFGLAAASLLSLGAVSSSQAATLNYTFDLGPNGFAQTYFDQTDVNNSRIYLGSGTGAVTYDTVTQILTMTMSTTGFVYGASIVNGNQETDRSKIVRSGVGATSTMTYNNVTQENSPAGIFGLVAKGSTGMGSVTLADLGLGGGTTPVSFTTMGMPMDFGADPGLIQTHREYTDIANLGAATYFQYTSTDPLSSFFNQIVFFSWAVSTSPLTINGINYGKIHADGLGNSSVPEPGTMMLLGCGLLGGLARRRKSA